MRGLALFGLIVLLAIVCFAFVYSVTCLAQMNGQNDEREDREKAYWIIIGVLIVVVSSFIIFPNVFGYEKIPTVSENVIESEDAK